MEEMFKLTRAVADTLDRVCATGSGSAAVNGSTDPGSSMLILSVYIRLLDMYQRVFSQVKMELAHQDANSAFMSWQLPDVTVGSFAVESSPFFQMSLAVQVAEEFLVRLRNSTSALDPVLGNSDNTDSEMNASTFADVVGVSFRTLKSKEENLGKDLEDLRNEIDLILDQ